MGKGRGTTLLKLKGKGAISAVFNNGQVRVSPFFVTYCTVSEDYNGVTHYMVIASKKNGGAVSRNRAKRLLRALLHDVKSTFPQKKIDNIILIARRPILEKKSTELVPVMMNMLKKLK